MKLRVLAASVLLVIALAGCASTSTEGTEEQEYASAPEASAIASASSTPPAQTPTPSPTPVTEEVDPAATTDTLLAAAQAHIDALFAGDAETAITFVSAQCTQQSAYYPATAEILLGQFPAGTPRATVVVTGVTGAEGTVNVTYPDGITEDQTWLFETGMWKYTGKIGAFCA